MDYNSGDDVWSPANSSECCETDGDGNRTPLMKAVFVSLQPRTESLEPQATYGEWEEFDIVSAHRHIDIH